MAQIHGMLLRIVMKERGVGALTAVLEDAGYYWNEDYVYEALFGEADLEARFIGEVLNALGADEGTRKDIGVAYLNHISNVTENERIA